MDSESALRRAKHPRTILAGPYGHPFHPLLVTIPIGAWTASIVFDIAAGATGDVAFASGATWLIGIGLVGAMLAAAAGLMDLAALNRGTRARHIALTHMSLNLAVIVLFAIGFAIRLSDAVSIVGVVLSVVALLLLAASGFLGGELVFRHGVRVADETTQRKAFEH
ncbi:Uncharacterized membrane protein [Cryobacterium psychrotolerans]|uniref:Uncharacterized membrane protein n=1 Tax=Cryobacterium psychrotolerans TaxID=386301 RepID=A0A1G9HSN6_9MICO|nr:MULTISPECIES: DUF2231 domain-containing protein [Cryobacterium]TFD47309.1 DUF2231 domain-containing protein [Cryobacterium sp. TMT1-2-1]TFD88659.1 DUF2231 domain-containing protein [Cryobacterium psychrotolerans]SDL15825.1 Uncharacterized membrane protein [Cryobacterium psychrotolerans]